MKGLFFLLAVAMSVAACNNDSHKNFTVEGTVKNTTAKIIYLEENVPNAQPVIMDSAELKADGRFQLEALTKEEVLYHLRLQNNLVPLALLISDVPKITVNADVANTTQPYSVEGSAATQSLVQFDRTSYERGMQLFVIGSTLDSLTKAAAPDSVVNVAYAKKETAGAEFRQYAADFFAKSNSPVLTLYTLSSYQNTAANLGSKGFSKAEMAEIVAAASAKFPQHTALQAVTKTLGPSKAPDFAQPGVDGQPVLLSSFKGKWVLLDFWASWCKPCRQDNPNVVKAYREFKDKNFTVFGVSLDQDRDAWLKAIAQDSLIWTHASDLKFWSNEAAALYGVQGIPANFLIDPQGNIVAQDLHGEEIAATLRRVIK